MSKIVYNSCFGGFSISDAAIKRYAEIKGISLYPEMNKCDMVVYWTKPPSPERTHEDSLSYRDFERDDPILIQVVEELGDKASGRFASLDIRDIPSGSLYRIDEYDGSESVTLQSEYDWKIAK